MLIDDKSERGFTCLLRREREGGRECKGGEGLRGVRVLFCLEGEKERKGGGGGCR